MSGAFANSAVTFDAKYQLSGAIIQSGRKIIATAGRNVRG
jgi:hypothetical protein